MSAMTVKVVTALNFSAERWLVSIKKKNRDTYATFREIVLSMMRIILFL
jgi:hypothetical protein